MSKPIDAECVGCGQPATHYCEGWDDLAGKRNQHGEISMSVQCGYPVCDTCTHVSIKLHTAEPL